MKKVISLIYIAMMAWIAFPATVLAAEAPQTSPMQAAEEEDDEDEPPYVEPAFTVYLNIDNPDAVYYTINDGNPVSTVAGVNTVTVDPGDGYIKVYVNEGYAFTKFDDVSQDPATSYLQYDNQTMPVTIRKSIGVSQEERIVVDGHTFDITTFDPSTLATYTLTVEVDDASLCEMVVGSSTTFEAGSNRPVTLVDGTNTVTYTEADKYLHVRGLSFMQPLQSATFNGKPCISDGTMNAVYSVQLKGSRTQGGVLVVTARQAVVEDSYHFTASIDDIENVRFVSRMPADKNVDFSVGDNTWGLNDGEYYTVWCNTPARVFTVDGANVDYQMVYGVYVYTIYPHDGSIVVISFIDPTPQFTLYVDDASKVHDFEDYDDGIEYELEDGNNNITINSEGNQFRLRVKTGSTVYSFTMDGTTINPGKNGAYFFTPSVGSDVRLLFNEPEPDPTYTVSMRFVKNGTEDFVRSAQINDIDVSVADFVAGKTVNAGDDLWISYDKDNYIVRSITVNGTLAVPYTGSMLMTVNEDTEIVFDVDNEQVLTINVDDAENVTVCTGTYISQNNLISLHNGVNELTLPTSVKKICIAPAEGAVITSVTDIKGEEVESDGGMYVITLGSSSEYTIATRKIVFDDSFVFIIDDPEESIEEVAMMTLAEREIAIGDFFNEVAFNSEYDQAVLFITEPMPAAVYVNGVALDVNEEFECYYFEPVAGDIVRVYMSEPAATHTVTFDVDAQVENSFYLLRDLAQEVDFSAGTATELHNTYYVIIPTDENAEMSVKVTANGETYEVEQEDGVWIFLVDSDMTVSVGPAANYNVSIAFTKEGMEGAIRSAQVNDEDVSVSDLKAGIAVKGGDELWISYDKDNYVVRSITVNGESAAPYTGSMLMRVNEDTEIVFDVDNERHITIDVDNAARVMLSTGTYISQNTAIALHDGVNEIAVPTSARQICIAAAEGAIITSVTDGNDEDIEAFDAATYIITVEDGMSLNITTAELNLDENFVLIIDDPEESIEGIMMMSLAEREMLIDDYFNIVPFNSDYDQAVLFITEPLPAAVYVNGQELEIDADIDCYWFIPSDGDIVRIYMSEAAETHSVTFEVADDIAGHFTVYRDIIQEVDHTIGASSELHNTYYVIIPEDGYKLKVTLRAPQSQMMRAAGEGEDEGDGSIEVPEDEGAHIFVVDGDMHINISNALSGVEDIKTDNSNNDEIYNLQGIKVTGKTGRLTRGIYIKDGRKVIF